MATKCDEQKQLPKQLSPTPDPASTQPCYGYPPPYQPYPPPYIYGPYNPNHSNQSYPTAPPPAAYYYTPKQLTPQTNSITTLTRYIMTITMIILFCLFTVVLLQGPDIPDFYVQDFSVPTFNVTNDALSATWDANMTLKKHIDNSDVFFESIEGMVSYGDDKALGVSQVGPFHMGEKKETALNVKFSTPNLGSQTSGEGDYKELVEERGKGLVTFSLKMVARVSLTSGSLWKSRIKFKIVCGNLAVRFTGPTGPGNLVDAKENEHKCLIYAWRKALDD